MATLAAVLAWGSPSIAGHTFIGAQRCKACHEFEFQKWSSGPHAIAHKSLSAGQLKDSKCNHCHTMVSDDLSERFIGVQCERCHGSGRYYHPDYVMRDKELARLVGLIDVTEVHCKECHTEGAPSVEPFDFAKMWAEIDHGKEARQKWEANQKAQAAAPR